MISARGAANLVATGVAAGAAILYRFSPQQYSFYPRCPFFAFTHHYCPGCGATRAMADLLHGNFAAALHFNAALTLLLPFVLCYFVKMYCTALRENRVGWPSVPDWSWKAAVACVAIFGITRMITQGVF
jgi:Protein of unknown function (DUF2752)